MTAILQVLCTIGTLAVIYLSGKKDIWTQRIAVFSQTVWWIYYVHTKQFGLLPMQVVITVLVIRSFILWERDHAEVQDL